MYLTGSEFSIDINNLSTIICKGHLFLYYWFESFSSWLLITFAIERLMFLCIPLFHGRHNPFKIACWITLIILIYNLFSAIPVFWKSESTNNLVENKESKCGQDEIIGRGYNRPNPFLSNKNEQLCVPSSDPINN